MGFLVLQLHIKTKLKSMQKILWKTWKCVASLVDVVENLHNVKARKSKIKYNVCLSSAWYCQKTFTQEDV